MKSDCRRMSGCISPFAVWIIGMVTALCSLIIAAPTAAETLLSGQSTTIFRMGKGADERTLNPLYEYLRLKGESEGEKGAFSLNMGGWGRADLRERTSDKKTNADLQYGNVNYQGKNDNLWLTAGRQFVAEGVATERLDGLYLRGDLAAGFGAAAFVGSPVLTEPNATGGDVLYGGRLMHSMPEYCTVGVSALRTDDNGDRIREEMGIDLWFHPLSQIDVTGRSSYNSITSGWMEHAYAVTVTPLEKLRIYADLSKINYNDYFYQVTTNVFSLAKLIDPKEDVFALGGGVEITLLENLRLTADYKGYDYKLAGHADYYGGKASLLLDDSFMAGASIHRMEGESAKLRYNEYRVYGSKRLGKANLTLDFFDVKYDSAVDGITNTYSATAAVAYDLTERVQVAADVSYSRSTDFNHLLSGLVKLTWSFDKKIGTEGGAKSEKK